MGENNVAMQFQDIENWNPILSGGFQATISTLSRLKPLYEPQQILGEGGKSCGFVGCEIFFAS